MFLKEKVMAAFCPPGDSENLLRLAAKKKWPREQQQVQEGLTHSNSSSFPAVPFYFICFHTCQLFLFPSETLASIAASGFYRSTHCLPQLLDPLHLSHSSTWLIVSPDIVCLYVEGCIYAKLKITYHKNIFTFTYEASLRIQRQKVTGLHFAGRLLLCSQFFLFCFFMFVLRGRRCSKSAFPCENHIQRD